MKNRPIKLTNKPFKKAENNHVNGLISTHMKDGMTYSDLVKKHYNKVDLIYNIIAFSCVGGFLGVLFFLVN